MKQLTFDLPERSERSIKNSEKKINYEMKHRKSFFQLEFEHMNWNDEILNLGYHVQYFQGIVQEKLETGIINICTFKCYENYLISVQADGQQKWLNFNNAVLECVQDIKLGNGIKLTKCLETIEFYGEVEKWIQVLKRYCIQLEFNKKFFMVKKMKISQTFQICHIKCKKNSLDYQATIFCKQLLVDFKQQKQLCEQIKIMRSLQNEHIQQFIEIFENQEYVFIITEILFGGNLNSFLKKQPIISEDKAARFCYTLFRSLAYMHSKFIMHRDIKPEKLGLKFKDTLETISICEFNIAEYSNQKDAEYIYQRCGTPGYVAPEILANEPYDCKVDVFSAGIILYQLITGNHPFQNENYETLIQLNLECQIDFQQVKMSQEGLNFLQSVLQPNPEDRLTSQDAINHPWFKFERLYKIQEVLNKRQYENHSKLKLPTLPSNNNNNNNNNNKRSIIQSQSPSFLTSRINSIVNIHSNRISPYHSKNNSNDFVSMSTLTQQLKNNNQRNTLKITKEEFSRLRKTLFNPINKNTQQK